METVNSLTTIAVNGAVVYNMLGNTEAACNLLFSLQGTLHPVMHLVFSFIYFYIHWLSPSLLMMPVIFYTLNLIYIDWFAFLYTLEIVLF